jgi:hypothetical protein
MTLSIVTKLAGIGVNVMKRSALSLLCILIIQLCAVAQKSVSDLPPAHASVLQEFLTSNPGLDFLSERNINYDYVKYMREHMGARFTPFYQRGDFNQDGRQDFAMILLKDAPPKRDPDLAESHQYQYQVTVVIFNGSRGGKYKVAFVRNVTAPLVCFINTMREKRTRLYFGVFETDEAFTMTPAGKGYIVEYEP